MTWGSDKIMSARDRHYDTPTDEAGCPSCAHRMARKAFISGVHQLLHDLIGEHAGQVQARYQKEIEDLADVVGYVELDRAVDQHGKDCQNCREE